MNVVPSMGTAGDASDNPIAESFFTTLEREVINRRTFQNSNRARLAIFEWIDGWYNPHRRHSLLGYRSPINFERRKLTQRAAQMKTTTCPLTRVSPQDLLQTN
jgi:putative transposase